MAPQASDFSPAVTTGRCSQLSVHSSITAPQRLLTCAPCPTAFTAPLVPPGKDKAAGDAEFSRRPAAKEQIGPLPGQGHIVIESSLALERGVGNSLRRVGRGVG